MDLFEFLWNSLFLNGKKLIEFIVSKSKVGDSSWGQSEGSLFNNYYTKV